MRALALSIMAAIASGQVTSVPASTSGSTSVGNCQSAGSSPGNCFPAYQSTPPVAGVVTATAQSATSDTFNVGQLSANITTFTINSATTPEEFTIVAQQSNLGLLTATYVSGGSFSGTGTCTLATFNGGGASATANIAVSSNTPGAISGIVAGTGYTSAPTTAVVTTGTATCSGTITITSTVNAAYTIASPTGFPTIAMSQFPNAIVSNTYVYAGGGTWVAKAPPVPGSGPGYSSEIAAPGIPLSGTQTCWNDSTSHTLECMDSSGHIYRALNLSAANSWSGQQTFTAPVLGAATATSLLVTGIVDGVAPITITTGSSANLGSTYNSGYTFNQEATAGTGVTYTLPATATGKQYCVRNSGTTGVINTGVLTVYPPSGSYVILNGTVNTVGSGGTHGVASGGAAGDSACFVAIDATHWEVFVGKGTFTAN